MSPPNETLLEWLLEADNPSVRYWALLDILGVSKDDPEVQETRDSIIQSKVVQTILGAQHQDGYWMHEEDMYLPKYTATTHQLLILAEHGLPKTPQIEKAIEHIFRFQRTSGHFLTKLPKSERGKNSIVKDGCCFDGNILYYLIHFGYLDDPRTRSLIDFILGYHDSENAGWSCRAYPLNPDVVFPVNCYMGATKILKAFSLFPEKKRTPPIKEVIETETENILSNYVYRYLRNQDGSRKDKAGWKRFGFPLFYQSDILEVLDTLTRLEVTDERMKPALKIVEGTRGKDGKWLLKNSFNGKMWVDIEEKHQPSKWITLRAMRILKHRKE